MNADETQEEAVPYRIEVAGELPPEWKTRLEVDAMTPAGGTTILELRVRDQAELLGRLRRLHDLNLKLVSLNRGDT